MTLQKLLSFCGIVAAIIVAALVPRSHTGQRTVTIALYDNPPKIYANAQGRPSGMSVELLEAMARDENWNLRYVPCKLKACFDMLNQGEIDLIPNLAVLPERLPLYDFNQVSVATTWSQVYAAPNRVFHDLSDLAGMRVAVMDASSYRAFFDKLMASGGHSYQAVLTDSLEDCFKAVAEGRADAAVTSSFFGMSYWREYGMKETPIIFQPTNSYFAVAKGRNADVIERIDAHLVEWRYEPDSVYYRALRGAMAPLPEMVVPPWLQWSLAALVAGLLLLAILTVVLRRLVAQRTHSLQVTAEELRMQRAHLEELVTARTSELQQAKDEAERLSQVKSQFLATMSHEIRTPMNAVLGMLHLAMRGELSAEARNYLRKAQGAARSLLGIINDILDFSKIEAGKLDLEQAEFGLEAVLEQLTDAIGYQAAQKGVEFLIRYDPTLPRQLVGDPLRLGQILLNLCSNAIKFTEQGEVELVLRRIDVSDDEAMIQICVRDSGIGMTADVQQKLFEKFTQADQSMTRRFGGTGLGLAISKNLVELMGGRIWIEDSEPGKGTTFCFTVRLQIAARAQTKERQLLDEAGPLLDGVRALVVDDNDVSRDILAQLLRYFHIEVDTAPNGPAALAKLASSMQAPYDVVLMDWHMPGMNGDIVVQRMNTDAGIVFRPKIIMVSAYGREEVIRLAEQAGVDAFLIKPVSPSILLDTVLSVLGRGRLLGDKTADAGAQPKVSSAGQLSGARLLLVEDNEINREFAAELLRSEGIEVDEAENGEIAVRKVQQRDYDGVLMDIQMPVMDGLEAARRIRALAGTPGLERFADLPIIAMTALAMAEDAGQSRAAGMNDHIGKPIMPERMMAAIAQWVHVPDNRATAARATPAANATAQVSADLQAISGVDATEGVRRIGGNESAYRKQLVRFREHYPDAVAELRRLAADEGLARAEEYCHALKGVTGNLGARDLHEKLTALDQALKRGVLPDAGDLDEIALLFARLLGEIDTLAAATCSPAPAGQPLSDEALLARISELEHTLEYDVGAAEGQLDGLRAGVVGTPREAAVARLAGFVDTFDIDAALSQLQEIRNSMTDKERT